MYRISLIPVPPTPEDINKYRTIRLLALQTNPETFGSTYEREAAFTNEQWFDRLKSPLRRTIIAQNAESDWVGLVAILAPNALEGLSLPTPLDCSFPVFGMWVHPASRGRGVGRRLMEESLRWAEDWVQSNALKESYVVLEVYEENEAAKKLYMSMMFKEGERRLGDHDGTIWMWKRTSSPVVESS